MSYFLALLIEGTLVGTIYALVALAFVLVYKASAMMNFALGEWIGLGVVLTGTGLEVMQLGLIAALAFAMLAMMALAAGFYLGVIRRLLGQPAISSIMATLALGMMVRAGGLLFPGPSALHALPSEPMLIGGVSISGGRLEAAAVAVVCTGLIGGFYRFSRIGIALRAIADDQQAAMASGIDIDRHLLIVWSLTGVVAVVAGVLWTHVTGGGFGTALIGLKIFPIVILGGFDSIAGTLVAAITIGVIESLGSGYLDEILGSGFGGIAPYLVLLTMLVIRPHGLFGQPRVERV